VRADCWRSRGETAGGAGLRRTKGTKGEEVCWRRCERGLDVRVGGWDEVLKGAPEALGPGGGLFHVPRGTWGRRAPFVTESSTNPYPTDSVALQTQNRPQARFHVEQWQRQTGAGTGLGGIRLITLQSGGACRGGSPPAVRAGPHLWQQGATNQDVGRESETTDAGRREHGGRIREGRGAGMRTSVATVLNLLQERESPPHVGGGVGTDRMEKGKDP
jgi:hypothetical protein